LENVGRCTPLSLFSLSGTLLLLVDLLMSRGCVPTRKGALFRPLAGVCDFMAYHEHLDAPRPSFVFLFLLSHIHGVAATVPAVETLLPQGLTLAFVNSQVELSQSSAAAGKLLPSFPYGQVDSRARQTPGRRTTLGIANPSTTVLARCIAPPRAQDYLSYLPG